MKELSPISYHDANASISLKCYADTFVYHKVDSRERNLVAMRFGGYPEQVRAMSDALRKGAAMEAEIEGHPIIITAKNNSYKRELTHDGVYAEGTLMVLDDVSGENQEEEIV